MKVAEPVGGVQGCWVRATCPRGPTADEKGFSVRDRAVPWQILFPDELKTLSLIVPGSTESVSSGKRDGGGLLMALRNCPRAKRTVLPLAGRVSARSPPREFLSRIVSGKLSSRTGTRKVFAFT